MLNGPQYPDLVRSPLGTQIEEPFAGYVTAIN